ncbi:unnamed protein product [Trichobilharzia szidati]|nr:unnamed protein product [Trichobilharzia szidati]
MSRKPLSDLKNITKPGKVSVYLKPISEVSLDSPILPPTCKMVRRNQSQSPISLATLSLDDKAAAEAATPVKEKNQRPCRRFSCRELFPDLKPRRYSNVGCNQNKFDDYEKDAWRHVSYQFVQSESLQVNETSVAHFSQHWAVYLYRILIDENGDKYSFF